MNAHSKTDIRELSYAEAIREAMDIAMASDERVILMGEDIGVYGGAFGVTGDLARLDEDGFLFLVDRAKDMLIRGGENIYCIEVENALYDHPAVMDASVVGIPHKVLGEEVGAVVQLKPGKSVTQDELRAHVASQLAAFKVPVEIIFQDEPLPRNANGKILKPVLREQFSPRN